MSAEEAFRAALLDPAAPVPEGLTDGAGRPAGRRYAVYRNNIAASLTEALETGFPAITRLIGAQAMRGLAGSFLRAHPPRTPLIATYGRDLPEFIAGLPALSHLPYLPDVARIDLMMRQSYHAGDHVPLAPEALAALDEEALEAQVLELAPSVRLLSSRWPVLQVWRYTMGRTSEKPKGGAETLAILRTEFDPEPVALPPGAYAFLTACGSGAPLGRAVAAAGPGFDLGATLSLLFTHRALVRAPKGPALC
ncbi:HvfC/BufC family peptide modification chaperone [Roseivivax sp.]